jgi:hypothetical protein
LINPKVSKDIEIDIGIVIELGISRKESTKYIDNAVITMPEIAETIIEFLAK